MAKSNLKTRKFTTCIRNQIKDLEYIKDHYERKELDLTLTNVERVVIRNIICQINNGIGSLTTLEKDLIDFITITDIN